MKAAARAALMALMVLVYLWFVLSLAWTPGEMSTAEKAAGVAYALLMVPAYEGLKRILGL